MILGELFRDAWRDARMQIIPTLLLIIVALGATIGALLTAGQQVAQQQILENKLQSPAAGLIVIRAQNGTINPAVVSMLQRTDGVEAAFGVGDIITAEPSIPGIPVTAWEVTDVTAAYRLTTGRAPRTGEAVIAENLLPTLGWDQPAGSITTPAGGVVGVIAGGAPRPGYNTFADAVLIQADHLTELRSIYVMAQTLADVSNTQAAALSYIGEELDTAVESSGLQIVSELTQGDYAAYARSMLLTVLALGAFLTAIVSLTYVLLYKRLLGRRRALGITRSDLALVTLIRIAIPIAIGAIIGGSGAFVLSRFRYGPLPASYAIAVVSAIASTSCLAAAVPIAWAVRRDPVTILRSA
ncbi:MAG: hypothetical protein Q4Q03_02570 [Bowdeniella nasicola]|nr:hypothetical protein [Bowdeniella nasicola]